MTTTFIKTANCEKRRIAGAGEVAEVINEKLCGAKNVQAMLRSLSGADRLEAEPRDATHQLVYLMEGEGLIRLEGKEYRVSKGCGIYLGPKETASIRPAGEGSVKLFHLVVAEVED